MKKLLIIIILLNYLGCSAQQENFSDFIFNTPQIVYFGIDFSHAQIIGESNKHKRALQDSILQQINLKFFSEQIWWVKYKFSKDIIIGENVINSLNKNYSATPLIPDVDSIQRIINKYPISNREGTGLVFIVASLDKSRTKVELYPVFFDISSKTIIWMNKESGTAHGGPIGLMHFWYPKVNNTIRDFINKYKFQKAENNVNIKPNNIYLKLLIDEVDMGYEKILSPDMNISVEAGYRLNYYNSWHYEGKPIPIEYLYRFLSFHGFAIRVDLKYKISRRSYLGWVLGYQRLYCPKVIWDPGEFDRVTDETYDVWRQTNDELVIQLAHHINLGKAPYPVQFFYGIGLKVCAISEQYSIVGRLEDQTPSNEVYNETKIQPLITFGLIFKLGSF